MPASLFHYTFVKENIDKNSKYFKETALGGQGPDVFFFYGYTLKKRENKKDIQSFGTYLHHTDIAPIYSHLIEYAKKNEHKDMLFAYLKGLFMHYILDRNMHPYIFYRSGFPVENDNNPAKYMLSHQFFEGALDSTYAQEHQTFIDPRKAIEIDDNNLKIISAMFFDLAKFLKKKNINEDSYYLAHKDMKFALGFLCSKNGVKKKFYEAFFRNKAINAMCLPKNLTKWRQYDLMNNNKSNWQNCVDGINRNESVDELVLKAKRELEMIDYLFHLPNQYLLKEMKLFVHEIDHDGFNYKSKKKYFKLYTEGM